MTTTTGEQLHERCRRNGGAFFGELDHEAQQEWAKAEREQREALDVVEFLARHLATPDCHNCHGEGMDWEGAEWALCQCVMGRTGTGRDPKEPMVGRLLDALRDAMADE